MDSNSNPDEITLLIATDLAEEKAGVYVIRVTEHNTDSSKQANASFTTTVTVTLIGNPCTADPLMDTHKWTQLTPYPEYDVMIGSTTVIDLDLITNGNCHYEFANP